MDMNMYGGLIGSFLTCFLYASHQNTLVCTDSTPATDSEALMESESVVDGGTMMAPSKSMMNGPPTTGIVEIAVPPLIADVELETLITLVLLLPRLLFLGVTPLGELCDPPLIME